jgi:Family of unknown function (DUF6401)
MAKTSPMTARVYLSRVFAGTLYYRDMSDVPPSLSAVALRLAGEVGQATLNQIATGPVATVADLDQHITAVREAVSESESARGRRAGAVARRAAVDARIGPVGNSGLGELLSATARDCPDVPFVGEAHSFAPGPPLALLLHYVCGFVEEAVTRDWWPADDQADAPVDWESMRIAAVCTLISAAEAEAELHPDLPSQSLSRPGRRRGPVAGRA